MDPEALSAKYHGDMAATYDAVRQQTPGWQRQQEAVEGYLSTLPRGATVLDVPVGTGRFLAAYERFGLSAVGADASPDMLAEARRTRPAADLREASIFELPFDDDAFDVVMCVRFLNWIREPHFSRSVVELARVSRGVVVAHIKTYAPARSPLGLLRQWKHRLYVRRAAHAYHGHRHVLSVLGAHGLRIDDVIHRPDANRHGVRSWIYLLGKRRHAHHPGSVS